MQCMLCDDEQEVRHINLYIVGSEGCNLCHACEMDLVTHIRNMRTLANRTKLRFIKGLKKVGKEHA